MFVSLPFWLAKRMTTAIRTMSALTVACVLLMGCSKSSGNSIKLTSPGGAQELAVKSGSAFALTKTFTDINGKMSTASTYRVYLANYDLDTSQFARSIDKPMTSDENVRVAFSLVGEEGTNDKSPLNAATYYVKADKFMKAEDAAIVTRKNGQDAKGFLERSALTGEVKINSVTNDTITGEINLASGQSSIKGPFVAKILERK